MDNNIPTDLQDLIDKLIAYKKTQTITDESELEYLYDYYEYPEYTNHNESEDEGCSTIIKINLGESNE